MAIRRCEAFVLNRMQFRETSLIGTFFSRETGKIKALFKGIRKDKKGSRVAAFEPFTRVSMVYYEKLRSELHLGADIVIEESQAEIRGRLDRIGHASFMTELVDTLFGVHDPHEDVFDLLKNSFYMLTDREPELVARVFELKVLSQIGWLPLLTQCTICGSKEKGPVFFSARQGGILCRTCDRTETGTLPISNGTRQTLLYFLDQDIEQATKLKVPQFIAHELQRIGERFLRYHLEYPLRSSKFLAEMTRTPHFMSSRNFKHEPLQA